MTPTMKSLGIDGLSVDERLALVDEIWESLRDAPGNLPIPESHRAELRRRLEEHRADPESGSPWADVRARVWGDR